jgi:hypothetical protein
MSVLQMSYGAALSGALSSVLVWFVAKERRVSTLVTCVAAAIVMPLCWNTILRLSGATGVMSHDLPFRLFPISLQDTGTGVFTLAGASTVLGLLYARTPARRTTVLALWTALAALLVDIYLY